MRAQQVIVLDFGNSRLKVGFFNDDKLVDTNAFNYEPADAEVFAFLVNNFLPQLIIWISVTNKENEQLFLSKINTANCYRLTPAHNPAPLPTNYTTPASLGSDRYASIIAAAALHQRQSYINDTDNPFSAIIFLAGTALTTEIIYQNTYIGGAISPGPELRYQALHGNTARLPKLSTLPTETIPTFGTDTNSAMLAGVWGGMTFEIKARIESIEKTIFQTANYTIIAAGSYAEIIAQLLKPNYHIQVYPHLILSGIYHWYKITVTTNTNLSKLG
jgi:type III pantothenate kinase